MRLIFKAAFLCIIMFSGSTSALADLFADARKSIVYIYFDVTDSATGERTTVAGTGFVVSSLGYILTASHLFRHWTKQSKEDKEKNPIRATLHDKLGFVFESPVNLQEIELGNPDGEDVAFLKLPDPHTIEGYSAAPVCPAAHEKGGDGFFAFGFPGNQAFEGVRGMLVNTNAPGGRWTADADFAPGMSGGPVYDLSGRAIGLVKGGLDNIRAVRWITPIRYATHFLSNAQVDYQCGGWEALLSPQIPPFRTSLIEKLLIRATDGHGNAISSPFIQVIRENKVISSGYASDEGYFIFNLNHKSLGEGNPK